MTIDPHSLRDFVGRWVDKSRRAAMGNDAPYVDEFMFAYVAFNAAYTAAAYVMDGPAPTLRPISYHRGGPPQRRFSKYPAESKQASQLVVDIAGSAELREIMEVMQEEIQEMCNLFVHGVLYLHETPDGTPDHRRDLNLINQVNLNSPTALLLMIYKLRCNLFHGAKQLSEIQRVPLSVSATFIREVIPVLLNGIQRHLSSTIIEPGET